MEIVPSGTKTVVSVCPFGFEAQGGIEFVDGLLRVTSIFKGQGQVVMCIGIVGFKGKSPMVRGDGLVPGLVPRELDRLLAVSFRGLPEQRRSKHESQDQQTNHYPSSLAGWSCRRKNHQ